MDTPPSRGHQKNTMEIHTLGEGSYSVDATKKFVPFNPQTDDRKSRPGSLFIHVNPFLIKTDDDLILLDSGLGYKDESGELYLHQHIRKAGYEPEEVTLVLMSHLHYDHSGGLVVERDGKLVPGFPKAVHVVQKGEWEFAFSGKSSSYHIEIFEALKDSVEFIFTEGDGVLKEGISYQLSGGHCPNHQVFLLEEVWQKVFFGGDELPEPEQLIRRFVAKYDYDGHKAMMLREEYGKKAADEGWQCLFYHSKGITVGTVTQEDDHFTVQAAV